MDEDSRRQLHERLDAILDRRAQIEITRVNALGGLLGFGGLSGVSHEDARATWLAMIALAKDVLGDPIRASALKRLYEKDSEQRKVVQGWLLDLWPLIHAHSWSTILGIAPQHELTIFDVMDALSALDAGEIRPLFVANKGKNRRANRWSLARAKLDALVWKKRLRALSYAEKDANYQITVAFGEQWDTIRRWKGQCEQILGADEVAASLDYAGSPQDSSVRKPEGGTFGGIASDPLKSLGAAGAKYRHEVKRSAELSRRKTRVVA